MSLVQHWPLVVFVVGVIVAIALAMLTLRDGPFPYQRQRAMLPPVEVALFRAMHAAVRNDWLVFSRVPLADVLRIRPRTPASQGWQRRLHGKRLDFVLCDPQTLEVKLAIQLVGSQALAEKNQFVTLALASAGLPLVRLTTQEKYEPAALRKEIEAALGIVRKRKRA
jgi:hypothetical protein